ncbi:MAG: hypothetical protein IKL53_08205 [Lachnospiraceae bacterium]|nr:hypothetical protein [Lachnospiraceae bacterium]
MTKLDLCFSCLSYAPLSELHMFAAEFPQVLVLEATVNIERRSLQCSVLIDQFKEEIAFNNIKIKYGGKVSEFNPYNSVGTSANILMRINKDNLSSACDILREKNVMLSHLQYLDEGNDKVSLVSFQDYNLQDFVILMKEISFQYDAKWISKICTSDGLFVTDEMCLYDREWFSTYIVNYGREMDTKSFSSNILGYKSTEDIITIYCNKKSRGSEIFNLVSQLSKLGRGNKGFSVIYVDKLESSEIFRIKNDNGFVPLSY